jgi:nicotinate-nucleotide pyrophosphorylase (carboxylating)
MDRLLRKRMIEHFLAEDIACGDVTSEAIFSDREMGAAEFVAQDSFVAAGFSTVAAMVFTTVNPAVEVGNPFADGAVASPGDMLMRVSGPVLDLLRAERVALNLVQRLCGIATMTSRFVERVRPLPVQIVDTRKTTPGLRILEKYAVRVGGGHNHRFSLAGGILIKDNHIAACGSITTAVDRVRRSGPLTLKIEVETENLEQVRECLACKVDIIMLDNMNEKMMRRAVQLVGGRARVEASGGVTLDKVRKIAATGVDIISVGALTHSAPACDISMRWVEPAEKSTRKKAGKRAGH